MLILKIIQNHLIAKFLLQIGWIKIQTGFQFIRSCQDQTEAIL